VRWPSRIGLKRQDNRCSERKERIRDAEALSPVRCDKRMSVRSGMMMDEATKMLELNTGVVLQMFTCHTMKCHQESRKYDIFGPPIGSNMSLSSIFIADTGFSCMKTGTN
jgi:hypothetical protein